MGNLVKYQDSSTVTGCLGTHNGFDRVKKIMLCRRAF